jgi:hypothetical protein
VEDEDQVTERRTTSGDSRITYDAETDNVTLSNVGEVNDAFAANVRKRRPTIVAAAAVAVVLVISFVVIGVGGPGSKEAAAEVILGARSTLAKNSVDLTLSGTMSANGQSVPIGGSGFADQATDLESLTLTFSNENIPIQETVLSIPGHAYLQIYVNNQNQVTRYMPGKQWVQMPAERTQSAGISATTPNILSQLQVLTQQGNTVVPLGVSTIKGETVKGFQVTITTQAMNAEIKRVESQGGAEAKALEQSLKVISLQPPVIKLWLNHDNLLVREEVVISITSGGATASGDMFVNFSNYGSTSSITPPADGSVGSFQDFMADAQASEFE